MITKRIPLLLAGLLLLPGFSAVSAETKSFEVSVFKFQSPEGWQAVPTQSSMRKMQFSVPGKDGADPAEVVFYYFGPGQGGDVASNVNRWFGQFQGSQDAINARTEKKTTEATTVTYAFAEGTYLSGPPFGQKTPLEGQALAGAILEDDAGHVFVKMTGPEATVKSAIEAFRKMAESATRR